MPRKKSRKRVFLKWLAVLVVGGFGGFLIEHSLLPTLAKTNFCERWQFFKDLGHQTTIINRTEEIKITENLAWQKIIDQTLHSLVGVKIFKDKVLISQANGLILTSDGLIVVPTNLIETDRQYLINQDGQDLPATLFFQEPKSSLVLLKIERSNLAILPLAPLDKIQLGELVLLAGLSVDQKDNWLSFVNQGLISKISAEGIRTNIQENDPLANGSVLLNIQGEIVGVNIIDANKNLVTIDSLKIKNLLEESLKKL